ncbi:MAG: His-Xaa-Ser system radical SAM maturase HxsB [Eggerthellaceae bacterium]|nr:His-Xaa-Ser system radical SAM maturase HxsB [Eggerthellaceae bacterium]
MINHFNFKKFREKYLLTNDFGSYAFLNEKEFRDFISGKTDLRAGIGRELCEAGFAFEGSHVAFATSNAARLMRMKAPLFCPTTLHILVLTTACNLSCVYCQAHDVHSNSKCLMNEETAERAIDIALQSPTPFLTFEFQGGEPLLNYRVLRHAVEYAEERKGNRSLRYSVVTNLTLLSDEIIGFFCDYGIQISTSLDGPALVHDPNRPFRSGEGSFNAVTRALEHVREAGLNVSCIQTTTRSSLKHAKEIVEAYCSLGFESIFIRPLTPLGVARAKWDIVGYTPDEFGTFYREALNAILQANEKGYKLREGHASMFFEKLFFGEATNYMELRSPCGASVGQIAYHANGDVFTCDEGRMLYEMGDASFRLGNVHMHDYPKLVGSPICRATCAASALESLPGCSDCVYAPYCGVCPVVNLALENDLIAKSPNTYRCGVYSSMLDTLFDIIYEDNEIQMRAIRNWFD